jgi:MFS family permease
MLLLRVRLIAPVLLGVAFTNLALGALSPVIAVLLVQRHAPTAAIGLVTSGYYLGFLAGSLSCARVVDRVGHIRAFAVFAAVAADGALLHWLVLSPVVWIALRLVTGYAMAGVFLIAESWLNDKVDAASRGRTFATYLLVSWAASAAGPLALNLAHPDEAILFILVAMSFATALVPMALTQVSNPEIAGRARFGVKRLFAISPLGVVACFAAGLVNSAFYGLLPAWGEQVGLGAGRISILLTTALVGGLAAQFPIGMLADRFGRRPMMLATLILAAALSLGLLALGVASYPALLAAAFLYAGATGPLYGLGAGQTNDYITPKEFVGASGGLLFAWALGASAGPTLASGVMEQLGPGGLFIYIASVLAMIALFTIFRMTRRSGLPVGQQSGFVPAPQVPARIAELDPRSAAPEKSP